MICNSLKWNFTYFGTQSWLSHSVECRKKLKGQIILCALVFQGLINQWSAHTAQIWEDANEKEKKKEEKKKPDRYLQMYNCVSCRLAERRESEREKVRERRRHVSTERSGTRGEMCWSKSLSPRTFISTNYQICPYLYLREADGLSREDGSEICKLQCFQRFCERSLHFICSVVPGLGQEKELGRTTEHSLMLLWNCSTEALLCRLQGRANCKIFHHVAPRWGGGVIRHFRKLKDNIRVYMQYTYTHVREYTPSCSFQLRQPQTDLLKWSIPLKY